MASSSLVGAPEEDEDFDDDEIFEESGVQLGTVVPMAGPPESLLFKNVDWHDWDGGKAGGWPVWLNPRDLPAPEDMRCGECDHPMSFLVQLYCPLDHEDDAFHRCLYVFCCPKASCSKNSSAKALRCQLPRENLFYPYEPDDKIEAIAAKSDPESVEAKRRAGAAPEAWGVNLCCVCGQLAKSACSKCRSARYCGREHQTQHWKQGGHKNECRPSPSLDSGENAGSLGQKFSPAEGSSVALKSGAGERRAVATTAMFREFEVEVRPEPPPPPVAPDGRTAEDTLASQMDLGGGNDGDAGVEDDDSKLSQAELDKIAGVHGVKDRVTLQFLTRTQANPQVIRYDADGAGPLWSSSKGVPGEADVPPCSCCGRARKFEFQVMPHLLHHLGVDSNGKAWDSKTAVTHPNSGGCMDWGTLAVYTCPDSCMAGTQREVAARSGATVNEDGTARPTSVPGYVDEFIWRQPPP